LKGLRATSTRSDEGIALIIVLSVLTMLLVIATPFVVEARRDRRTAVISAERQRARAVAEAALEMAKGRLERTHQGWESRPSSGGTPDYDSPAEFMVDAHPKAWADALGQQGGFPYMADPRGDLWSVCVEDEQGRIDADTAPPFLLAGLVGRTVLTKEAKSGDTTLEVESLTGLPPKNGRVLLGTELLEYRRAEGTTLSGVSVARNHEVGSWVLSGLALDLAQWNTLSRHAQGGYKRLPTVTALKDVSRYGKTALPEARLDSLLDVLTVHGRAITPSGWVEPVRVVAAVDPEAFRPDRGGQPVRVRNPDFFNAGTMVRLGDGKTWEYHLVTRVSGGRSGGTVWLLDEAKQIWPFDTAVLQAEARRPVNINSASRDVLVLLLEGLEYSPTGRRDPKHEHRVTRAIAESLADMLIQNRPIRGPRHLVNLLSVSYLVAKGDYTAPVGGVTESDVRVAGQEPPAITPRMAMAIVQNAINPLHRSLLASTMPFGYVSGDWFRVEALASVNDGAGTERAHHRLREVFRTGPAEELLLHLDRQVDFERSIVRARSGRFVETHPVPMSVFQGSNSKPEWRILRYMTWFEDGEQEGLFPDETEGDVRLQPARMETVAGVDFEEHFDGAVIGVAAEGLARTSSKIRPDLVEPEGFRLEGTAYPLPLQGARGGARVGGGNILDGLGLLPFVVRFWIRPRSFGAAPVFFSITGPDPTTDFVDASWNPGDGMFHFRLHDNTIDDPGGGIVEAAEVTWAPPPAIVEDDTWFHISLHAGGSRPEDLVLLVDGFARGRHRFVSRLASGLSSSGMSFTVEDAEGWPDSGAFWIGTEVVHAYRSAGSNTFNVFSNPQGVLPKGRGARGTSAVAHVAGESVRLFGYSSVLSRTVQIGQAGEVLPEGQGALASSLAPFNLCAVTGNDTDTLTIGGTSIGVEVLDLAQVSQIDLEAFPGGQLATSQETFQTSGGYAVIVAPLFPSSTSGLTNPNNLNNQLMTVAQLIRFQGRQGARLTGVTSVANPFNPQLADQLPLNANTTLYTATLAKIVTRLTGGGPNSPGVAAIFPISVHLTDAEGYKEPELANGTPRAEYIQLGQPLQRPTFQNFASHRVEWIAYYGVDRAGGMLLCHERSRLASAVNAVRNQINAGGGFNPGGGSTNMPPAPDPIAVNNQLRFRSRAGTDQFRYFDPSDSAAVHPAGNAAIPVFRTTVTNLRGETAAGYGDSVTVISPVDDFRGRFYVAWTNGPLVALTQNILGRLNQIALPRGGRSSDDRDRRRYTRLVKFPSGEMPNVGRSPDAWVGGDAGGGPRGGGLLDEVRLAKIREERFVLWDPQQVNPVGGAPDPFPLGLDDSATEIPIVQAWWVPDLPGNLSNQLNDWLSDGRELLVGQGNVPLPTDAGLVLIDDEIIAYRGVAQGDPPRLLDCERGFMGTTPERHGFGSNITFLDWRVVSRLTRALQPDDYRIAVQDSRDFPFEGGTVLVGREMAHYVQAQGGELRMPQGDDPKTGRPVGIFRGRYGTLRGSHPESEIVLGMPFRYWDRYAPNSDDPELAFFGFSMSEARSFIRSISWHHRFDKPAIGLDVLLRFDPEIPWDTPPQKSAGKLLLLESASGRALDKLNRFLLNRGGKGLEGRVFFTYRPDAIDPVNMTRNDWKETPRLLDLELRYLAEPIVGSREALQ